MAGEDIFGEMGSKLVSTIFGSILWVGLGLVIAIAIIFTMWFFLIYKKKFDIEVKLTSNRSHEKNKIILDKAAILKDWKEKIPYFRVWGLRRDFPVPRYEVLQSTNKGDYVEIYRKSEEEFYFLTPSKIDKFRLIKSDGIEIAVADQTQTMVDPEMAFWAQKRKSTNKKMFDTEGMLMKILPYIPQLIGGVILIFTLYILMDHLPSILSQLEELVRALNQAQNAQIITGK
ncbi:MAG TPA: hypothetical protein VJ438_01480 [Candidatus Nanoarchaeia archaeon]|nr:hypothetical protein [Candidatus Nanoarchaeia archaeon]